jgi:hypothetical protein
MASARSSSARLVVALSAVSLGALGYAAYLAYHSPHFLVRVVEVADLPADAPVTAEEVISLAAVPVGRANLFDVDLAAVEKRVLANDWIREVRLQKRFPQTLSITVGLRRPRALMQAGDGSLAYVDQDGRAFAAGRVSLARSPDLPLLPAERLGDGLKLLDAWERARLEAAFPLASLAYDADRGFRALVAYRLGARAQAVTARATVDLGHEIDVETDSQLGHLRNVFNYLVTNGVAARQIWTDIGKKIVVKTARGS